MSRFPVQARATSLYGSGVSIGDTTARLSDFKDVDGNNLDMTKFGDKGFGTNEPGTENEESIIFTGVTDNLDGSFTLTGVKSILAVTPFTETVGFLRGHSGGTRFVISNTSAFYESYVSKNSAGLVDETITFDNDNIPRLDGVGVYGGGTEEYLATKRYVDSVALAGAPDASATAKGVAKLTTAPTSPTDPIAVGATDVTATPTASRVPRADGSGKLSQSWLDLTATWTFAGIVDITASLWKLGGVAFTGTMALLNEAATFFGATDITGAEAETLSSGPTSNANAIHTHPFRRHTELIASQFTVSPVGTAVTNDEMVTSAFSPDGLDFYVAYRPTGQNVTLYRFTRDVVGGYFYLVSEVTSTGNVFASASGGAIVAGTTFVYFAALATGGSGAAILRFARDLTGQTTMTMAGSDSSAVIRIGAGDDTKLWLHSDTTDTTVDFYSISGTTATRGTSITGFVDSDANYGFYYDGTDLLVMENPTAGTGAKVKRYNTSGVLQATGNFSPVLFGAANMNTTNPFTGFPFRGLGFCATGTLFIPTVDGFDSPGGGTAIDMWRLVFTTVTKP